jgi:hypothetical protein
METKILTAFETPNKKKWTNKTCEYLMAYLVLDEELDTLDGSSSSLRDSGRNTTHCRTPSQPRIPMLTVENQPAQISS